MLNLGTRGSTLRHALTLILSAIASIYSTSPGSAQQSAPKSSPPAATQPPAKPTLPALDEVLKRYIAALGGTGAIKKRISLITTASFDFHGQQGTAIWYAKAPNLTAYSMKLGDTTLMKQGFDGTSAWVQGPDGAVREASGQEQTVAARGADFYLPLNLREAYGKLSLTGTEEVNGHPAYVIEADPGDGTLRRMYIDVETALLVRSDSAYQTPQGPRTFVFYLDDYRAVNGVQVAFLRRQSSGSDVITFNITSVEPNVPIDDAIFAKPSPPPPPSAPSSPAPSP